MILMCIFEQEVKLILKTKRLATTCCRSKKVTKKYNQPSPTILSLRHNKHKLRNACLETFIDKIVDKYMPDSDMKSGETKFSPSYIVVWGQNCI